MSGDSASGISRRQFLRGGAAALAGLAGAIGGSAAGAADAPPVKGPIAGIERYAGDESMNANPRPQVVRNRLYVTLPRSLKPEEMPGLAKVISDRAGVALEPLFREIYLPRQAEPLSLKQAFDVFPLRFAGKHKRMLMRHYAVSVMSGEDPDELLHRLREAARTTLPRAQAVNALASNSGSGDYAPQPDCGAPAMHLCPPFIDVQHARELALDGPLGQHVAIRVIERVWKPQPGWRVIGRALDQGNYRELAGEHRGAFDFDNDSHHAQMTHTTLFDATGYGMVPGAGFTPVTSMARDAAGRLVRNVAAGILNAALTLRAGNVILIEEQRTGGNLPVETDLAVYDAIQWATAAGLTVVEPAGNGGQEVKLGNSGAILVAASLNSKGKPHQRYPGIDGSNGSNYGEGIHCHAVGDITLSDDGLFYTGTSAAAAQIAGVVALVQSLYKAKHGTDRFLRPADMRKVLVENGTSADGEFIGTMPDLPRIIRALELGPP